MNDFQPWSRVGPWRDRWGLAAMVFGLLLGNSGCKKNAKASAGAGPAGAPAVQVVAVPVRRQAISESLSLPANITANEMVEIKVETEGIVESIRFDEGQRVEKGALLITLDQTRFDATLAQAEANHKLTTANFDRAKQLFLDKLISQQEYDQTASLFASSAATVDLMRRQAKDARIHAPFAGITGARLVSPGQVVSRNTTLTWLVDLDTVKLEVQVPEKYLGQIALKQSLEFSVAAFPGEQFHGEVYFVSPQVVEATRTALVKARIANPGARLKGGMYASLELNLRMKDDALVIPEPALLNDGDTVMVFVIDAKTNAVVRPIKVGLRLAGQAEVLQGLNADEWVVVEGIQKLRPGAPVRMAPAAASAPYLPTPK